jgi:hypothetical protein
MVAGNTIPEYFIFFVESNLEARSDATSLLSKLMMVAFPFFIPPKMRKFQRDAAVN